MNYKAIFAVIALAAALAAGQDPQARGKQIVEEAIAALGGEKFLTIENRVESGRAYSFYQSELSGLSVATYYTRYVPVPEGKAGRVLAVQERQAFGEDEYFYVTFREEGAWEVTYRGRADIDKDLAERHRRTIFHDIFYILRARRNEPGLVFDYQRGDVVDNMPVHVVDVVDADNRVVTVYFHQTTKLPVRQDWTWRDPRTRERFEEITRFGRYRTVDGIQWPFQFNRTRNGEKTYEAFFTTVAFNQKLDDSLFAIPASDARPQRRRR